MDQTKDLSSIIVIDTITSNNLSGVTKELKNLGYQTPFDQMNVYEAKSELYKLYMLNPDEFWIFIEKVPFNYNKPDVSNSPSVREKCKKITCEIKGTEYDAKAEQDNKEWWANMVNSLKNLNKNKDTTSNANSQVAKVGASQTNQNQPKVNYLAITGIILLIILILILIFKK